MAETIETFRIAVPQPEVDDLRRRLRRTRWPSPQPVADWSHVAAAIR